GHSRSTMGRWREAASAVSLTSMDFSETAHLLAEELERYRIESASGAASVVIQPPMSEVIARLRLKDHIENGGLAGEALAGFVRDYLALSARLHHPGSLAHQVAVPHPAAAFGMLVEGLTNNPMAIYE